MNAYGVLNANSPTTVSVSVSLAAVNLPERTRAEADRLFAAVAQQYLEFRREYYHEEHPSLQTAPPSNSEIRQTELARMAEGTLRLVPQSVKSVPVLGGLVFFGAIEKGRGDCYDDRTKHSADIAANGPQGERHGSRLSRN